MPKIVVAIPYWESDPGKRKVLYDCTNSLKGYDSLVVLAGRQSSLPLAWNMCLDMAFGMGADYCIVSNDDVILDKGSLQNLCVPDAVLSPRVNNGVFKIFHAHMFALPKKIFEKVGRFDERFRVYWSDTDYAKRLKDAGVSVGIADSVNILHKEPGRTIGSLAGITEQSDKEAFVEKWGKEYHDPIKEE